MRNHVSKAWRVLLWRNYIDGKSEVKSSIFGAISTWNDSQLLTFYFTTKDRPLSNYSIWPTVVDTNQYIAEQYIAEQYIAAIYCSNILILPISTSISILVFQKLQYQYEYQYWTIAGNILPIYWSINILPISSNILPKSSNTLLTFWSMRKFSRWFF